MMKKQVESESKSDFFERRDKYIKDLFIDHVELAHPCKAQGKICLNGKYSCPFIGLPNDACVYYLRGKCTRPHCKYQHSETYARFYRQAIDNFNRKDREPLTVAKRCFKIIKPYVIWLFGVMSLQIMRNVTDYVAKKLL